MLNNKPTRWVIGNWKMNPGLSQARQLSQQLLETDIASLGCQVAVAPTMLHLLDIQRQVTGSALQIAAQDIAAFSGTGAYTGDVSAQLLADADIGITLLGHSERRSLHGEGRDVLRAKLKNAIDANLKVVFCVGETLAEREAEQAEQVVLNQLKEVFDSISLEAWQKQLLIAYEPVWAIGTGKTASPADAQAMHAAIRAGLADYDATLVNISILYGGSVKPDNAASLAACPDVDGALVGGASLEATSFIKIAQAFAAS